MSRDLHIGKPELGRPEMTTHGPVRVPSDAEIRAAAAAFAKAMEGMGFVLTQVTGQVLLDATLHALLAADKVRDNG